MAEKTVSVNKKFNITLIIVFVLIVLVVGYFLYQNYQAKKALEAKADEEMDKLTQAKKEEKKSEKPAQKPQDKKESKQETVAEKKEKAVENTPVKENEMPVVEENKTTLIVEENPAVTEEVSLVENVTNTENVEIQNNGGQSKEQTIIEETTSRFIGKDVFVGERDIRIFAEPNTKSMVVAQFKLTPNGNKLFIGRVERVFVIDNIRWLYIRISTMSEGLKKGYVKEQFVNVKAEVS
jgi:hypothetical protein